MKILLILSLSLYTFSATAKNNYKETAREKQNREHLSLGILSIFCPVCGLGAVMADATEKNNEAKKPIKKFDKLPKVQIKRELASIPE